MEKSVGGNSNYFAKYIDFLLIEDIKGLSLLQKGTVIVQTDTEPVEFSEQYFLQFHSYNSRRSSISILDNHEIL